MRKMKKSFLAISKLLFSWGLIMPLSACKNNDAESLKRAQTGCVQAIKGSFSQKQTTIKTTDISIQALALQPQYTGLLQEWEAVKQKPFLEESLDPKIMAIISNSTLSSEEQDKQIIITIEATRYWKEICSVQYKDLIKQCADKFQFDSVNWTNCIKSSPMARPEFVGEWSPYYGEYFKRIHPKLKEAGTSLPGQ